MTDAADDVSKPASKDADDQESHIKDRSPDGRYCHYGEKLGVGSFKTVYMAFDREAGTQLAWNQIALSQHMGADEFKRIYREISLLKQISHASIIRLFDSWIDEEHGNLIFVTEAMTSGTLSQFRKRLPVVSLTVVQSWAKQLLSGLDYLHTRTPIIIHRDVKSNNIFMDATSEANRVKIGDLGLATLYTDGKRSEQMSVIGTPEYMAPEFYTENYNQLVDIWAFGLVMLEMVTNRVPYAECNGATAQIFLKVSRGVLPGSFADLRPGLTRDFIAACLLPASVRPSAAQLLQAPFILQKLEGTTDSVFSVGVPGDEAGKSPGAGRMPPTPSAVTVALQSPREATPGSVTPATGGSPSNSPAAVRAPVVENTTQNLQNLSRLATQGPVEPKTAPVVEEERTPVTLPKELTQQKQSSPTTVEVSLRQSPEAQAPKSQRPSVTGQGEPPFVPAMPATTAANGVSGSLVAAAAALKVGRQSVDLGSVALAPQRRSQDRGVFVGSVDFVPLSLVVNGVEGDKLSLCLTALRMENGGVHEKKVNFFFDVSGDNVVEDAEGLVQANRPDFELDVEEVAELLGRRVAENMHLTNAGRRLRLAPSPVMPALFERAAPPVLVSAVAPLLPAANTTIVPQAQQLQAQQQPLPQSSSQQQSSQQQQQQHPPPQPERSRSASELVIDIDAKRQQMLEKFASELRGGSISE